MKGGPASAYEARQFTSRAGRGRRLCRWQHLSEQGRRCPKGPVHGDGRSMKGPSPPSISFVLELQDGLSVFS